MTPKKKFIKTKLSKIEKTDSSEIQEKENFPPKETKVYFFRDSNHPESFDFSPFYGKGIDAVTYACQGQIERSINGIDGEISVASLQSQCTGLKKLLTYLANLSNKLKREVTLRDINRSNIDGFIDLLSNEPISKVTQRGHYSNAKSVLKLLCRRGLIVEVLGGDDATFPRNPYPGIHKAVKGHRPLRVHQRNLFAKALMTALTPIYSKEVETTPELLSYALLAVALHTGRNTTPLLEMTVNCLTPHPKEGLMFLTLFKRRGYSSNKVVLRDEKSVEQNTEAMPTV